LPAELKNALPKHGGSAALQKTLWQPLCKTLRAARSAA